MMKTTTVIIRPLTVSDRTAVMTLDDLSGNDVIGWIDDLEPDEVPSETSAYGWGCFYEDKLIGYCTIGGADVLDDYEPIVKYPGYVAEESLLLSDVFIIPEYRHHGYALHMIKQTIEKKTEKNNVLVLLTVVDTGVGKLYEKVGFHWLNSDCYVMVKDPKKPKYGRCKYFTPGILYDDAGKNEGYCSPGAKTFGELHTNRHKISKEMCETCKLFKSRYIEYPLTINGLDIKQPKAYHISFQPVRVRLCGDNKTYFGILLGDLPYLTNAAHDERSGILSINTTNNPCILIPEQKQIVFGAGSWWSKIEPDEDISDITDLDIENTWYVKLLKEMSEAKESDDNVSSI